MARSRVAQPQTPFHRDERVLAALVQLLLVLVVGAGLWLLVRSTLADLQAKGLAPGLGFLDNVAGFAIGEGAAYDPASSSYLAAFRVGLGNTLRVAGTGILLATLLGALIALGRLSGNPLVERLGAAYVEVFRNTPLLVQLIFWYQGVVLRLPGLDEGLALARQAGPVGSDARALLFLSQRGLALPRFRPGEGASSWLAALALGALLGLAIGRWRRRRQARTGRPAGGLAWGLSAWLLVAVLAWAALPAAPYTIELPAVGRFKYEAGRVFSPEFTALLIGLVAYSAAFIAEVIRAGIVAVSQGQREAARALGLTEAQGLRLVVIPQALRVIVPPLTSQYLNLTKNSTLAIYIGFPDLFNVSLTIGNNTGQFVVVTLMIMAVYLAMSLGTSLAMNAYNRRIQLVER